ncbi:Tf2-9, partial [Mucuna pruriens]
MTPLVQYLEDGRVPEDGQEARRMMKEATKYTLVGQQLYRRGFAFPLLKCLEGDKVEYVMKEIYEGICGTHIGRRALASKIAKAGNDCMNYVKKCNKCQRFVEGHKAPPERLHSIISPWTFCKCGVDILGPFPMAPGQIQFLIMAVDYFTKWVEAEPVATISPERKIICRFGIPAEISNGQAEATNRVILKGLWKRLEEAKGRWAEELPHVLWSYHTTPHSTTNETPFRLTFRTEAVIPVEIGESFAEAAHIREYAVKTRVARAYNKKVVPHNFKPQDLVLRRIIQKTKINKLMPSWEGPFRVIEEVGQGAYRLESLGGKKVPRTWNAAFLQMYYN